MKFSKYEIQNSLLCCSCENLIINVVYKFVCLKCCVLYAINVCIVLFFVCFHPFLFFYQLVDRQKNKLDEQKDENVEITQELRLTRYFLELQFLVRFCDFLQSKV